MNIKLVAAAIAIAGLVACSPDVTPESGSAPSTPAASSAPVQPDAEQQPGQDAQPADASAAQAEKGVTSAGPAAQSGKDEGASPAGEPGKDQSDKKAE